MKKIVRLALGVSLVMLFACLAACSNNVTEQQMPYPTIFAAIEHQDYNAVKLMAAANTRSIYEINEKGLLPLHMAAYIGQPNIVKLLIERGSDVNREVTRNQDLFDETAGTPLHIAASRNNIQAAEELLLKGAKINAVETATGWTPLHKAAIQGHEDMVKLLLEKGADPNAKSKLGFTPLHEAARKDRGNVIPLLVEKGSDMNARDQWNQTPLKVAYTFNKAKAAEALSKLGAKDE